MNKAHFFFDHYEMIIIILNDAFYIIKICGAPLFWLQNHKKSNPEI